jgi:hypothetical protein
MHSADYNMEVLSKFRVAETSETGQRIAADDDNGVVIGR